MPSKVYFTAVQDSKDIRTVSEQCARLLDKSGILDVVREKRCVAVKMHFGEAGNTGFVDPAYVAVICKKIVAKGATAFLTDTNTLYKGRRKDTAEHLKVAREHGFTKEAMGLDIVIPDETKDGDVVEVPLKGPGLKVAKIGRLYREADAIVAISHFKGHILTSFGGVLKNVGMGCASRQGKLAQHCDVAPTVYRNQCVGCCACQQVCPVDAIHMKDDTCVIDKTICIGCASCIDVCPETALFVDMGAGNAVQDKMTAYAAAVLKGKPSVFINFAVKVNKECDCWGAENPRIAPDVGILASLDPVSVDKASYDLVVKACGKDVFKEAHPDQDGLKQLERARDLGLGNLDYELITVS